MTLRNTYYTRLVLGTLLAGLGLAFLTSLGTWIEQGALETSPIYLFHLPYCLGLPYFLLGAPVAFVSAPERYVRLYSRGIVILALLLAGAWCVAAIADPTAAQPITQMGLLYGWLAGGTTYEILLIILLAGS